MTSEVENLAAAALRHRFKNGRHLHHAACIHNLSPEIQVDIHGRSVDDWMKLHGSMPVQITPAEWECEPPFRDGEPA